MEDEEKVAFELYFKRCGVNTQEAEGHPGRENSLCKGIEAQGVKDSQVLSSSRKKGWLVWRRG